MCVPSTGKTYPVGRVTLVGTYEIVLIVTPEGKSEQYIKYSTYIIYKFVFIAMKS